MKHNMSKADRAIRIVIAVVISWLYFNNIIIGAWGVVLMLLSIVFVLTSFLNFCPLYTALGIKRWEKKQETKPSSH